MNTDKLAAGRFSANTGLKGYPYWVTINHASKDIMFNINELKDLEHLISNIKSEYKRDARKGCPMTGWEEYTES